MKRSMRCSDQKRRRFLGGRRSREARKSAGMSTASARARSSQEPGLRERMTSPVSGSLRMNTSHEVKRKSGGKRTARLRPFLKSLAILGMAYLRKKADCARHLSYTVVYHKFFENKWECDPYT